MALINKKADFNYVETDPYSKTEQWVKISRQSGQVPVLSTTENVTVVDSNRVVEFVDHKTQNSIPFLV